MSGVNDSIAIKILGFGFYCSWTWQCVDKKYVKTFFQVFNVILVLRKENHRGGCEKILVKYSKKPS